MLIITEDNTLFYHITISTIFLFNIEYNGIYTATQLPVFHFFLLEMPYCLVLLFLLSISFIMYSYTDKCFRYYLDVPAAGILLLFYSNN